MCLKSENHGGLSTKTGRPIKDIDRLMFTGFEKIVEQRIREAVENGRFNDLEGKGKPLKLENDMHLSPEVRMARKILKNADCLPPEIEIKKDIQRIEDLLAGEKDLAKRYGLIKKMNFMIMKFNTLRNTAVDLDMPQYYSDKLAEKLAQKTA